MHESISVKYDFPNKVDKKKKTSKLMIMWGYTCNFTGGDRYKSYYKLTYTQAQANLH